MSKRREDVLRTLLPALEIMALTRPIDLREQLSVKKVVVDFGSGMGAHAIDLATNSSDVGVLAIDVHTVGLCAVAESAHQLGLTNIRTHHGDGIGVITDWLAPSSISEIHILFPDPWPKVRHQKRRLISVSFLNQLHKVLEHSGLVKFVTDDESYFDSALITFGEADGLNMTDSDWDVPNTTYHKRAIRLGNTDRQITATKI